MKKNVNDWKKQHDKGLELLAEASAAMLYTIEELEETVADDEIRELEDLREKVMGRKPADLCVGYSESDDEVSSMAAEEECGYR